MLTVFHAALKVSIAVLLIPIIQYGLYGGITDVIAAMRIYVLLFFALLATKYIKKKVLIKNNNLKEKEVIVKYVKTLLSLKVDELERKNDGEILSTINNEWKDVKSFLDESMEQLFLYPFVFIFTVTAMALQNYILTAIIVFFVAITSVFTLRTSDKTKECINNVIKNNQILVEYEKNCLESLEFIKTYGLENYAAKKHETYSRQAERGEKLFYRQNAINYLPALVNEYLPFILFAGIALFFVRIEAMQYGEFAALLQLTSYISLPMSTFLRTVVEFKIIREITNRIHLFFSSFCPNTPTNGICQDFVSFQNALEVNSGNYKYEEGEDSRYILNNINLNIKPGEKIAIVGKSGSGKSTLINLLAGFYAFSHGEYKLDSNTVVDDNRENLANLFSYVNEKLYLLPGSVLFNIILDESWHNDDRVDELAKQFFIENIIQTEREVVQFGSNFSGGQQLKISLARALYKDAPILLLDEPTAHLDKNSKSILCDLLRQTDKTVIFSSHDLDCVRMADKIHVLNEAGEIAESGNYCSLNNETTLFFELFHSKHNE